MTAEKQYVEEFESAYQGKTWSKAKIFGIMAVVCIGMILRDIGMMFVYGSIYDEIALEGADATISLWNYVFMILLYALPLIMPMILRLVNGAYDNEIEGSLLPSFNSKVANIIFYIVVGLVSIIPVVLSIAGVFTSEYMFVAMNIALLIVTSVTTFYYCGTYILQRARMSLKQKYILPTLMMVVTSAISFVVSVGTMVGLSFLNVGTIITHITGFFNDKVMDGADQIVVGSLIEFIVQAVLMFCIIAAACVIAGLLYNYTQNIIYSAVPTFVFAYSNVVLLQRINEASSFVASASSNLDTYKAKLATATSSKDINNFTQKINEIEASLPKQQVGMILGYVLLACIVVVLLLLGIRAIVGLVSNLKEAKNND